MKIVLINEIIFSGKRSFPWKKVEEYLHRFSGDEVIVKETGDKIMVSSHFVKEYCGSVYTKKLHGSLEKAKANAAQVICELIENATNRRWIENKDKKHENDAKKGWYRYDVFFAMPVEFAGERSVNHYRATLIARINDMGIFLHDMINI